MAAPNVALFATRRFAPLFVVQFLGAFNDNLLRFAMVFLATFTIYRTEPARAEVLSTLAAGLFTLPFLLLSSIAGQLADGLDKSRLVRWVKLAEIAIMAVALAGFHARSIPVLLGCVVAMGVHSALFGPVKYSILPQHLRSDEIMGGTGLIEAGTFLAILAGQLTGGLVTPMLAGLIAIWVAVVGLLVSLLVPPAPPQAPLAVDRNIVRGTVRILRDAHGGRGVWLAILGISWFYSVGAIVLSQLPMLVSATLRGGQDVVVLFLLLFSLGVASGSMLINLLLRGEVSARFVPVAALVMAASLIALWASARLYLPAGAVGWRAFATRPQAWPLMGEVFVLAAAAGAFVVPLYAILQVESDPAKRSRVIGANNIVNAIMTVATVAAVTILHLAGVGVPGVLGALGLATGVGAMRSWQSWRRTR